MRLAAGRFVVRLPVETLMDWVVRMSSPQWGHFTLSLEAPQPVSIPTATDFSMPLPGHFGLTHLARMFMGTRSYILRLGR
jgi:hypothetical protein